MTINERDVQLGPAPRPRARYKASVPSSRGREMTVNRDVFEQIMASFETHGAIQTACDAVGVTLGMFQYAVTHNAWQEDYAASYRRYKDSLTRELTRRARDGVQKPVFYKGEIVGHTTEYSDRLLELAAKAHDTRFRDASNGKSAHGAADGEPQADPFSLNLANLSQSARDQVRTHLAAIRGIIEADVAAGTALIPPVDDAELPVIDVGADQ